MLAFLPDGREAVEEDPLTAFLRDDENPTPFTPPWLRLYKLSQTWPSGTQWTYHEKACGSCEARVTYSTFEYVFGNILDFTLCLNCGQVIGRENTRRGKPLRLPVSGTNWNQPCLAVKMLRKTAFRARYAMPPPWMQP